MKVSQRARIAAKRRSVGERRKLSESKRKQKLKKMMKKSKRPLMTLTLRALRLQSMNQQRKSLYQILFLRDRLV